MADRAIGAPAFLVGLLAPVRESGSLLPPLLIAGLIRRLAVRKYVWVLGSLFQPRAIAGIGLSALRLPGAVAEWAIILLLLFSAARGFSSISSKDLLGKTIPKAQRGQTTGWAASAAGPVTLALGAFLIWGVGRGGDVVPYARRSRSRTNNTCSRILAGTRTGFYPVKTGNTLSGRATCQ